MLKKLGGLDRIVYAVNTVAAILLLVSLITPYIPPQKFALLSALSLAVSPLLVLNLIFALYWILRFKRRFMLSLILVIVGYFLFDGFVQWNSKTEQTTANQLKIMSFNVQLFEVFNANPDGNALDKMNTLIGEHEPDIVCIQEYYRQEGLQLTNYPHSYIHFKQDYKLGHAIFSKYPLINKGAFDFEQTSNNSLYTDVVLPNDTLRLYNLHLQSYKITPTVSVIQSRGTQLITKRLRDAFKRQQVQVTQILNHKSKTDLPTLMVGDLNNTAFSYVYRQIRSEFNDAFVEQGRGLGATFKVDFYPVRIDYIFTEPTFKTLSFEPLDAKFSDHQPILATIGWD